MRSLSFIFVLFCSLSLLADSRPQVLIIGDIIYNGPTREVSKALKSKVKVSFVKYSSWDSTTALANFDKLLEGKKWDLIHFNYGLNDLMHKDPTVKKSIRVMHKDVGGVRVCSEKQYEKNLTEMVKRLKATGAKVIWASTTPIIGSNGIHFAGDEVKYNQIAAKVMKKAGVPINDMHTYGKESHKKVRHAKTYNYKGGKPLHAPLVDLIVKQLKIRK